MENPQHIVLIGAGIMSATLGVLLKKCQPACTISIFERLDRVAAESSDTLNNAGTGHSAFCELNYTPENEDGSINTDKAVRIARKFGYSCQFWDYLTRQQHIPADFLHPVPHISFVWGAENVAFLKKRVEALSVHPAFEAMQYSDDPAVLETWMPLVMRGRAQDEPAAASKMDAGLDVDFGTLTRHLFQYLTSLDGVTLHLNSEVRDLCQQDDGRWKVAVVDLANDISANYFGDFVFIGAGGGSLPLLDNSGIPEADGYAGFPISGQWLVCHDSDLAAQHTAKVYGKASVGAPPMSVPHLDTRYVNGKKMLLFGPFAGFSSKFLKHGSYWDLPASVEFDNLFPMLAAGWHNFPLTKYLIGQITQSMADRMDALRAYFPEARDEDWELAIAGQRVQVIKPDEEEIGVLEFGTELVCAADGSLAALLGASPGASTAVAAMLEVLEKCFTWDLTKLAWRAALAEMIPGFEASR